MSFSHGVIPSSLYYPLTGAVVVTAAVCTSSKGPFLCSQRATNVLLRYPAIGAAAVAASAVLVTLFTTRSIMFVKRRPTTWPRRVLVEACGCGGVHDGLRGLRVCACMGVC